MAYTVQGSPAVNSEIELLTAAQSLAHVGSFRWDVKSDEVQWSNELYLLYGLQPGSRVTREVYLGHVHADDRAAVAQAIGRCLSEHSGYERDYRIVRPSGEVRWVQGCVRPVVGDDGSVVALYGTCHDVTERKQTEGALAEARSKLERAELARRHAAEINDNIIHWLVQATQAMDSRDDRAAREAIQQTLKHASRILTELEEGLPRRPGR